ncbi:MAG: histidine kinase, partial [Bacteroidota bacterium]
MSNNLLFHLALHALVLGVFSYNDDDYLTLTDIAFFVQYATAAAIINYGLMPYLFYLRRYLAFGVSLLALLALVITCEELCLEPLFYPKSRANSYPGTWHTLTEILPVIGALVGGHFTFKAFDQQKEIARVRELARESELSYLRAQVNPHFLFNHLHNLYAYAVAGSPRTPELIMGLSENLRYVLYESEHTFVLLSQEIAHLHRYVELMELQIEDRGTVTLTIGNSTAQWSIAPLILQSFVENAFKHTTASQEDNIRIDISLEVNGSGELEFR